MNEQRQRPGFMVYFEDWNLPRQLMTAEQFKRFFDAVFVFVQDGTYPEGFEDNTLKVFFETFSGKIIKDNTRYEETCKKRSAAAKKSHGGNDRQQLEANASNCMQDFADAANTNTNPNPNINSNINLNTNTNRTGNTNNQSQLQQQHENQRENTSRQMPIRLPPEEAALYTPDEVAWFEEHLNEPTDHFVCPS